MIRETHYLDHNATSPLRDSVVIAVEAALRVVGNGSSVHGYGRAARKVIEDARAGVAGMCHAVPDQVTFTSGGTEANNLALRQPGFQHVFVSAVEHPSVLEARPDAIVIPVTSNGIVDLSALGEQLATYDDTKLISVMYANNETGIVQPVSEIAKLARIHGSVFHCDAVQAAGKAEIDVKTFGADLLTLSAHKIGGPAGIGALINVSGVQLEPRTHGGGQEKKVRSGTENLIGIAGFGAAAREVSERGMEDSDRVAGLRDTLEQSIFSTMSDVTIVGHDTPRLGNTTFLIIPGANSETMVMGMDLKGVAISAGSACSSGTVKISRVLQEMGFSDEQARSGIRVSLGWSNTKSDVEAFVAALRPVYERAQHNVAA